MKPEARDVLFCIILALLQAGLVLLLAYLTEVL